MQSFFNPLPPLLLNQHILNLLPRPDPALSLPSQLITFLNIAQIKLFEIQRFLLITDN